MSDDDSNFKGRLIELCESVGIACHTASPGNHRAVLNERFHRCLNKAQKLHAADCQSLTEWIMGTLFALYAWNASPTDGTNIIRSFAAKGREFPFPIDLPDSNTAPREHVCKGDQVISHVDAVFPLLRQQQQLLSVLNADRKDCHLSLKNKGRTQTKCSPGDLAVVKKQANTRDGVPQKLMLHAKGPYRTTGEADNSHDSYQIRKLPFLPRTGRPGKIIKESAARMQRLPSVLACHKKVDGTDTRLAATSQPHVTNPLEKNIGLHQFGTFNKAPNDANFAFTPIEELWQEETDSDSDDDEDGKDNNNGDKPGEDTLSDDETVTTSNTKRAERPKHTNRDPVSNNNTTKKQRKKTTTARVEENTPNTVLSFVRTFSANLGKQLLVDGRVNNSNNASTDTKTT